MENKRLTSLVIKMNDGTALKIKHDKYRQAVEEASNKFRQLLKKHKLI